MRVCTGLSSRCDLILKTDVLLNERKNDGRAKLRDLKRELLAVEDSTTLSVVFETMLDKRAHQILVVDEYGGMQGIVTLEDVVETLIGIEIVDEVDKTDDMRVLARSKWEERMERVGIDVRETTAAAEEEAAAWEKEHCNKPIAGFIAGATAPPGRRMGHAGAIVSGGKGTAEAKKAAFCEAGIGVAETPSEMADTLLKMM